MAKKVFLAEEARAVDDYEPTGVSMSTSPPPDDPSWDLSNWHLTNEPGPFVLEVVRDGGLMYHRNARCHVLVQHLEREDPDGGVEAIVTVSRDHLQRSWDACRAEPVHKWDGKGRPAFCGFCHLVRPNAT